MCHSRMGRDSNTSLCIYFRAALEFVTNCNNKKLKQKSASGGSIGKAFLRSYRGGETPEQDKQRSSASKKITFRVSVCNWCIIFEPLFK